MALAVALATWSTGAMTSQFRPLPGEPGREPRRERNADAQAGPKGELPFARGQTFTTLDAYLAFRRQQGAIDLPWYEEVEPGIFMLRTSRRPPSPPQRFTRRELARKFGFES